ncbi:hypothetical protein [Myroides odoratimimus]|uniref:hypothetical protein n=1 Tax=Myroides odoratimimus TaxID=76832 RepID=UPI002DBBDCAD|nr:hypothetical protein [Myroides odoratimimus]MEC4086637.1 hypothetical protein [Myroides odoratimimus]
MKEKKEIVINKKLLFRFVLTTFIGFTLTLVMLVIYLYLDDYIPQSEGYTYNPPFFRQAFKVYIPNILEQTWGYLFSSIITTIILFIIQAIHRRYKITIK